MTMMITAIRITPATTTPMIIGVWFSKNNAFHEIVVDQLMLISHLR